MKMWLVAGLLLLLRAEGAEALAEPELCYVLDAVLFTYGIILTVLYCRLKLQVRKASKAVPSAAYSVRPFCFLLVTPLPGPCGCSCCFRRCLIDPRSNRAQICGAALVVLHSTALLWGST
ncbi:hypothetical protein KIL84_005894 [Mauremys mutica]|uniref:Uncharacterized protein n=1 Tax=Mauremys mutica TaxID=74926 RepID=A0A9D3XE00_9SAUR|nr:hypothetical protein KIL84_005894 [Mauremys mutica]